jgi:serine O-acetyltransferase
VSGGSKFWRHFLFTPGFKYTFWMRLTGWAILRPATRYTLGLVFKFILLHYRYKYGIAIPEYTEVGPGLFINRFGGIYVNGDVVIGSNVNIGMMTLLGQANRGERTGSPTVGNRVFVGVGSSVIGRVHLGDGSVVGVNSVVTRDVPENAVVGGTPAKVLSTQGSEGYVNRLVPDELLAACLAARTRARPA